MKAKDWKFEKYLPDAEDIEAQLKSMEAYFSLPEILGVNEAERELDIFNSGFIRGIAWCLAKHKKGIVPDNAAVPKPYSNKIFDKESLPYQLADLLIRKVSSKRNTYQRYLQTEEGREALLQKNAYSFDLLLRKDKKEIEEVLEVLAWSQEDDFWKDNILSADKFRLQYDRLLSVMTKNGIGTVSPDPNYELTQKFISIYRLLISNDDFVPSPLQYTKFRKASEKAVAFFMKRDLSKRELWPDYILRCLGENYVEKNEVVYPGHFCSDLTWDVLMPQFLSKIGLSDLLGNSLETRNE